MFRTRRKIEESIDYTKLRDGSWQAEFRGFADVMVAEKTLGACQSRLFEEIDSRLADFVVRTPAGRGAAAKRHGR